MKDLYKILEVDRKASIDVIEKAYKVLAKKYHPDLQNTQESKKIAEEKIKKINEAYEILKNEGKRKKYDLELEQEEKRKAENNVRYNSAYRNTNYKNSNGDSATYNNEYYNQDMKNNSNIEFNKQNYQSKSNSNKNNNINNTNINNQNSEIELTEKQRKKLNKKLQRKMQDEYLRAYGDYLTKNGYKVAFRINWRKLPYLLIIILIVIVIGAFLWYFPVTNKYLISLYEENVIIKKVVDIIISIFN